MRAQLICATAMLSLVTTSAKAEDSNSDLGDMTARSFSYVVGKADGSFLATISYSLSALSQATSFSSYLGGSMLHGVIGLYSYGNDGLLGTGDDVLYGLQSLTSQRQTLSVTLSQGRYYYAVSGRALAESFFQRVSYRLELDTTAAIVPEPAAFAMLAAGLGFLAWRARSRRSPGAN